MNCGKLNEINGNGRSFKYNVFSEFIKPTLLCSFFFLFDVCLIIVSSVLRAGDADFCVTTVKSRKLAEAGLSCTQDGSRITTKDCP